MPRESVLAGTGWKDLPPSVQTHILSFLFEYPEERSPRPVKRPLHDFSTSLNTILPNDLLSVAASSPDLRDRVEEVLGPRAQYLTVNVTGDRLDTWVSTMGKNVEAISAKDSRLVREVSRSRRKGELEDLLVIKRDSAFRLFQSLHEEVKLQVLDLKDVPLYDYNDTGGRLLNSLVGALEQSGESLKELSLPVAELCSKALERVSFSNLQVVEFELRIWERYERHEEISDAEDEIASEACKDMLRSLDGNASGSQNGTTIRELRLLNVHTPWVDNAQSNFLRNLRNAVTTLRLECLRHHYHASHPHDSDVMFISLFPNLKSLHWNGVVVQEHLEIINSACSNMQELHLRPATVHDEDKFQSLEAVLLASEEKVRTLDANGLLSAESMKRIGELCPGLRDVRLSIERETVGALASLLGLCPHIRRLTLDVFGEVEDDMHFMEWDALVDAFHSASDQLSEVDIIPIEMDCDLETIVQSFIEVVAILGERARDVRLHGHMTESGLKRLVDATCDILRACLTHSKKLECLILWLNVESVLITESEEQEKELARRLLRERRNLIEAVPQMHTAYLGPFDGVEPMRSDELTRSVFVRTRSE